MRNPSAGTAAVRESSLWLRLKHARPLALPFLWTWGLLTGLGGFLASLLAKEPGRGVAQLEAGYTYTYDDEVTDSLGSAHLVPRALPWQQVGVYDVTVAPRPGDVSEDANLFAQQEANRRRSTWLVVGFILFFRVRLPAVAVLGLWFVSQFFIGGGHSAIGKAVLPHFAQTVDVAPTVGAFFGLAAPTGGYDGVNRW